MSGTVRMVSGLLMVCLACAIVMSDEPQLKQEARPDAKEAEAKQADAKKSDPKAKKEKKVEAPTGYEDAPVAGNRAPRRNAAIRAEFEAIAVELMDAEDLADVGEDIAQVLAAKVGADVLSVEKQFLPQFQQLVTAELSFIHRACDLNLEQRKRIKAASDTCLRAAVRKYAMSQRGIMIGHAGRVQPTVPDPTELLHQALTKVLHETLQPEQQAAYDGEMSSRRAFRKRVAIENVIAIIDERLVLTNDQRQRLTESLDDNWQPAWLQSMEMLMSNNQYLPNIPDAFVVPALNETQRQIWRAAQKQNYMTFGLVHWNQQGGVLDDFPLVETEADVKKASTN